MTQMKQQRGRSLRKIVVAVLVLGGLGLWWFSSTDSAQGVRKQAQLATMEMIGDAAAQRMGAGNPEQSTHGSAVDLIQRPIEIRSIADNVHYATGVGNVFLITTSEGNVVFDTGLVLQSAKQMRLLKEQVSDAAVTHVIVSHSHADHSGGAKLWLEESTEIVAHEEFTEEQRYLTELEPYFYGRNRTLFPWIPEERPDIALMRYGGIEPTITVDNDSPYIFTLGGVEFHVIAAPGAEGADNIVLWLPQQKMLFSGDFFGPQFPQFPNVFTMRGEKVRKPMEYVTSLDKLLLLEPEIIVPSHFNPSVGGEQIAADMRRIRDAVQYVHDATVAGMNTGKSVYELMQEVQLPPHLDLVQNHGKVDWAVKSIWEYYATWFHFESTTELYPVPAREVYADLAEVAGSEGLLSLASNYLAQDLPVKALHVLEIVLEGDAGNPQALTLRREALQNLMQKAENGLRNDYEIYYLRARLADTEARLNTP